LGEYLTIKLKNADLQVGRISEIRQLLDKVCVGSEGLQLGMATQAAWQVAQEVARYIHLLKAL